MSNPNEGFVIDEYVVKLKKRFEDGLDYWYISIAFIHGYPFESITFSIVSPREHYEVQIR